MFKTKVRLLPSILAVVLLITLASLSLNGVAAQSATGDFAVALSNTGISVPEGSSGTLNLYVTSLDNFAQTVSLTFSGPAGVTASFNGNGPSQVATSAGGTASSTVTINVDDSVEPGTYPFIVTGISPTGLSRSAGLQLTVLPADTIFSAPYPDFLTQPSPAVMTLTPSVSKSTTMVFSSVNGFTSSVSLSVAWTGVAPDGVTVSLPSPVTVPADGSTSSILTLTADDSPSTGIYTLVVTATNGVIAHSSDIGVTIAGTPSVLAPVAPDFSISSAIFQPSPAVVSLTPAMSQSATIILSSVDGFSSIVSLTVEWNGAAPNGVSVSPSSPVTVTVPASGSVSSTLTLTADNTPSTGSYMLLVTASNDLTSHSTEIPVIISDTIAVLAPVTPTAAPTPGFSLYPSTDTVSMLPGLSGGTSVVVNSLGSFSAPVTFSASWVGNAPTGIAINLPQTVAPPAGGQVASSISFTTTATASTGTYIIRVTGTSGSVSHRTDITLLVNSPGPFTIWPILSSTQT